MYARLDALWQRLSGARREPLLQSARRRFLTFTAALTIIIGTAWVGLTAGSVIADRPIIALLCALVPVAFVAFPYLALRSEISLDLLSHAYLITLYIVVALTVGAFGGPVSTTSFFLMLLPLLGTLLFGIRVGMIWVAVIAATYAGLHLMREALPPSAYDSIGAAPHDWVQAQEVSFWNAVMMVLLSLAGALSVANFRAIVGKSSALLAKATTQTEDARAAQAAAEDLARSKAEFMANVSHELRTPLNAVIGYTELLIENAEERGDQEVDDSRKILEAALKLHGMINDILRLAAVDADKVSVEIDECYPSQITREAIELLGPLLRSRQNRIIVQDEMTPGAWFTDSEILGSCVRNLIANGAHCARDGELVLTLSHDTTRSHLIVEVRDNGGSLASKQIEMLFEPFAQPEFTGARYYEGMALNLALTRRLARLLGGELTVQSNVGAPGATFRLDIPARFSATSGSRAA
jgi:signal transduction histidine kinase